MGLTDLFSKLIVEHGSAEVQSKHIALFKDQLALADKRILEFEAENATLKSKLENTETTIQELTKENEVLRRKIQEYEIPPEQSTHDNLLQDSKVNILLSLYNNPKSPERQIAHAMNMGMPIVEFHLKELRELQMVKRVIGGSAMRPDNGWSLDQEGTRYLLENKLV